MRLSRFPALVTAFLVAAILPILGADLAQAARRAPAAGGYVALGDSYASGVGAGAYEAGSGDCRRSTRSYPALWAAEHGPSSFAFTACSGARTGDVLAGQLAPLNASTTLVSISVGGNDAGFADVMSTCVLQSESACVQRVDQARAYVATTLPGQLDQVYAAIGDRASSARVVVLGYPRLYRLDGICVGLSDAKRAAVNTAATEINAVTAKRAADHGFAFGDVTTTFTGHELCSGDPWLHAVTLPVENSYHPTAAGQARGYLPVFSAAA